jgi:hypothetical protein
VISTTVMIDCDGGADDEDWCEARFEVIRDGFPDDLFVTVNEQLRLRGWTGSIPGRVTCPLHIPADQPTEVAGDE